MSAHSHGRWVGLVLALFALVIAFVTAPNGQTQDGPPKPVVCKYCQSTGRTPCGEHPRGECDHEDEVLYCSTVAECALCGGTGWVLCKECGGATAQAALDAKKADVARRKPKLAEQFDQKMGRALCKVESQHFVLVFELERIKVDKKFLNRHEAIHLYAKRLEDLYADYCARLVLTDKAFRKKTRVLVWGLPADHEAAAVKFCGESARGGVKLLGDDPAYSVCGDKQNFQNDERLYRNLVHSVSHLLLSAQEFPAWMGNAKGGWCDEGLAHWFEDRLFGVCDNYCYQEADNNIGFKGGKYRVAIRKLIESNEAPSPAIVFERNSDTLTPPEHAAAFSYVDYLISRDGEKFRQLCNKLKKKVVTRDALKEIFGFGPLEFEGLWKAWVLQTYPTK